MRWVGRLFALVGFLLFVAVGVVGFEAYLSITGRDPTLLNAIVGRFGDLVAGQRTEKLSLDVSVEPDEGMLRGRAHLQVKPAVEGRRRFYFLLGDSFTLSSLAVAGYPQARAHKLWLVTVVDLGRAAPMGETLDVSLAYEGRPASGLFGLGTARVSPREVQLSVDSFWFPNDLQGPFDADVTVHLPTYLTVVHAGEEVGRAVHGAMQRVQWRSPRPVPSLSLVAGPYRSSDLDTPHGRYRLYLADDVQLDADKVLHFAADADELLTARYGPSGFSRLSLFVNRKLRRAYNDGAGVMGLSIRYFRRGDYGFNVIAHEIAHNWWGATVMEQWFRPRTGGEWLVEGFAEFSSMLAAEERYGREALARRLAGNFFDPRHDGVVGAMSVLDNAVGTDAARETIYSKGGYVAMMLRREIGDDAFFPALRTFLERKRYQQASDAELEAVLSESTGKDLKPFFDEWVRSDHGLDLAVVKAEGEPSLLLRNDGRNTAVGAVVVAGVGPAQANVAPPAAVQPAADAEGDAAAPPEPEQAPASPPGFAVGASLPLPADGAVVNADPDLAWADMTRDNNRFPRRRFPLAVALGQSGWAEIESEVYPWSAATLKTRGADGAERGTWELPSTVVSWPEWLDEHALVLNTTDAVQQMPAVVVFETRNGESKRVGRGTGATAASGSIYAAHGDSLVRWQPPRWEREVLVRQRRWAFGALTASPDGTRLAYAAARDNDMEIRVLALADRQERTLLRWDRDLRDLIWSADGTRLYAAIGGNWDWQVWEIAVADGAVNVLVRDAAAMGNLALSPDGGRLAVAAAPHLDYPFNRREIVLLDLGKRDARVLPVQGRDVRQVVWEDEHSLLAVVAPSNASTPFTLPEERSLVRVDADTGRIAAVE